MDELSPYDRRRFLRGLTLTLGSSMIVSPLLSMGMESMGAGTSFDPRSTMKAASQERKLGIALVGLGQYSSDQLAPALQKTQHCRLAGIVTGTPSKAAAWKEKYDIPDKNIYNYENFDEIRSDPDIDVVYVVLPNSMHAEFTIRAAGAGKHVICEKPMATSVEDAQRMLEACQKNNVLLGIGYRLQYEPHHQRVMELGQQQVFGKVIGIRNNFSETKADGSPDIWRLNKELSGGGPLMDLGIYCVQGACYTMGNTPVAVTAEFGKVTKPEFFHSVEESISWRMEFDDGVVAECESSYNDKGDILSGTAENGWWRIEPSYSYSGKKGVTSEGPMDIPDVTEQVLQMDAQAKSFMEGRTPEASGEMGLRDMKILMAIYESARNGGKRVEVRN